MALHQPKFDERTASDLGIGGVPAWLIDDELVVSGAQPHEAFDEVMQKMGHEGL